jgi:hypothetical protein
MLTPTAPVPPTIQSNYNGVPPDTMTTAEERMQKFAQIAAQHEINNEFASRLRQLEGYEIVFLCDDSGSMATAVGEFYYFFFSISTMSYIKYRLLYLYRYFFIGGSSNGAFGVRSTRWDELKQIVCITVDIASVLDPDGLDIYFLNRPPVLSVKHASQLATAFSRPPNGLTPITRVLRQILQAKQNEIQERKLLIIIATDGQPTDDYGTTDIDALERVLKYERQPVDRILITFCACTDDDQAVGYLNKWDQKIPFLDVCDDYRSEREEIWKVIVTLKPIEFS